MAENNVDPVPDWNERALDTAEDTLVAMENLLATLRAFEDVLRQQDISIASSTEYCDNFCQALMHYAGSRNSMDHGLPLLEVYCLSINCFAVARSHLTAESDRVALVLKRLALSCFELFLSVPENEIPYEAWIQFHQSVQLAHDMLLDYGSTDLQALLQITGEGGAWSNPVLTSLLTGQPTDTQEVDSYISLEGEGFMEMRVKHLEKMGELAKAVVLAKACVESNFISNKATFRQTYVSLLCHLLPNEEAISEISRLDCKDVLEITNNLEMEGDENTAFILCTTFLTQQLQQQSLYCSWELILLWSKLQRRLDPTLGSFLERCIQLGAIAKTVHHLLYLVRVIQMEVEEQGVATSVELCVKALQLPKQDDSDTRISVCKTISCLLSDDLEVCRACLLTEFLLGPGQEVFHSLQELYLCPDQKYDQENVVIPNSLRCELLLALKSYWPFDPEFWDWKTLKRHCTSLLGLKLESEGEEENASDSQEKSKPTEPQVTIVASEVQNKLNGVVESNEQSTNHAPNHVLETETKTKKKSFWCQICKRSFSDVQLNHHSKRHAQESIHSCPICVERFRSRKELVSHLKLHTDSAISLKKNNVKPEEAQKRRDEDDDIEPGEIVVDPSLMKYYQSTHDPDVLHHIVQQANTTKKHEDRDEHVNFDYMYRHFNLQNRDVYPCPGTCCTKVFKHSKYLYVHLKSEHRSDENVKYFQKMKDRREKCAFCRRHLVSAYHYRKHRKIHHGDQPYMCLVVGCGARFRTSNELVLHKQSHGYQLNYQCELKGCCVTYSDLGQVYHHEAQHFRDAAYTCTAPKCKKFYLSKKAFTDHLATHNICFSEHDFEAQRKAKRKRFKSSASEGSISQVSSDHSQAVNGDILLSSCFSSESSETREAKNTLVAVCFDGSKFTCGFEKCGMSFSRARDVQRHLKCAHPEHLKMENKEHKHDRERDSKSKGLGAQSKGGSNDKGQTKSKMPFLPGKSGKEKKSSTHTKTHEASAINDALKEIVIGLGKLDLNCSSSNSDPTEPTPETDTSEMSLHLAIMEKPAVVVLQKKILHLPGAEMDAACEQTTNDGEEESLATAKPYVCEVKSCGFRTAQSYSLLRHYTALHGRTLEQARKLTSLKDTSFKPYICQLCSKALREKALLRVHYIQKHNLSATLVDRISCGSVRCEGNKTAKIPEQTSEQNQHLTDPKKQDALVESYQAVLENGHTINRQNSDSEGRDSLNNKEETDKEKVENEAGTTHQGRAKRLVAKSNLCYILDKFSKPFHCVAKNCDAAFSTQGGLVRHLQLVHHYNRSQLLVENEFDEQSPEVRKEPAKKRPPSNSDEPQPQYKCHFANCHASYHLKSSLARHTRDYHSQPELIRSKYDVCHNSELKKPQLYNQCEYYDSLVLRLQSTHKNSLSGCQKKLIVPNQTPQREEPDTINTPTPDQKESIKGSTKTYKQKRHKALVLRSHEEALQMCQDRCFSVAYPCMVQDCDTVVQYLRSLRRHYIQVHHLRKMDYSKQEKELVFNAELLEEMIQRKSVRSTEVSSPNGVKKMEYQTEAENPEGNASPMSLHPIKAEAQGESGTDQLGFPEEEEEEEEQEQQQQQQQQPSVERNSVLVGADHVLYGEPSTGGNTKELPTTLTQKSSKQQERLSLEQIKPLLRPVTVDLSPPRSLRFITEEGFVDLSNNKEKDKIKDKLLKGSVSVSISRIREPLKRKNDLSEQSPNVIDTFDMSVYKPGGFESSFLNFIKDSAPIDKTVSSSKRQNAFRRSGSVKENKQLGISHSRRRTHSPLVKPHSITGDITTIQNLKSILDKALAGCGDLAIKQLQYLRPVVVLGRPVCLTTLSDFFPADTNNSKLLLGS